MTGNYSFPTLTPMTSPNVVSIGSRTRKRPRWEWCDRVRKVRRDLGLTQAQFSELTGFGEKAIASWESGRSTPDVAAVSVQLESTTNTDRLWWLGWLDSEPENDPDGGITNRRFLRPVLVQMGRSSAHSADDLLDGVAC